MFELLEFKERTVEGLDPWGKKAHHYFPNGYSVSVIQGEFAYTDNEDEWEVAILKGGSKILYNTPITNDVVAHASKEEVEAIMQQVSEFKEGEY